IKVTAGPHRVSAAFIRRFEGPAQDLISPLEWSIASTSIADAYGFTTLPHLRDFAITGPFTVTGISQTPSRRRIFTCHPDAPAAAPARARRDGGQEIVCAREIITRLASEAFRRPLAQRDLTPLMDLYQKGAAEGGFEAGVRRAVGGILASTRCVVRVRGGPAKPRGGRG